MTEWRCGCDTRNWPVTHSCKALTHSGSPQPFDSTNSRQTALIGSKVLCYLFGTVYVPLQLDPCCINKKSVKEVFCCTKNEHDATRIPTRHLCAYVHGRSHCSPACRRKATPGPAPSCVHALRAAAGPRQDESGLASHLLRELVEFHLRLRPFSPRVCRTISLWEWLVR